MRVIAGSARRLPLKTLEGDHTRPTTDRIKETLFNILQTQIPDASFLDLFSGSGGIAIEALSRGAKEAVLVEQDRRAAAVIRENLHFTHLEDGAQLMVTDAVRAISLMRRDTSFDIIFMDPPYDQGLEERVLEALSGSPLADEHTLIIIEASLKTDFSYLGGMGYHVERRKEYKTNVHVFVRKGANHEESGLPREL